MFDKNAWQHFIKRMLSLTPDLLLNAYRQGYFPMAQSRADPTLYWFCPEHRGVLPLDAFHLPRSLQKLLRKNLFTVTLNKDFNGVILGCATAREETWINPEIQQLYTELHRLGHAHSVECWLPSSLLEASAVPTRFAADLAHGEEYMLVGGLYGVSLGGAFFGESIFSHVSSASKVALAHLVEWLKAAGYMLLDTQYVNEHLVQFGVLEIPRKKYLALLQQALEQVPKPLYAETLQSS